MNSLLLITLIWLPVALLIDVSVRAVTGPFVALPRKALFYLITLPVVWFRVLEAGVSRVSSISFVAKMAEWFKK